jgi:hypothetical protein
MASLSRQTSTSAAIAAHLLAGCVAGDFDYQHLALDEGGFTVGVD